MNKKIKKNLEAFSIIIMLCVIGCYFLQLAYLEGKLYSLPLYILTCLNVYLFFKFFSLNLVLVRLAYIIYLGLLKYLNLSYISLANASEVGGLAGEMENLDFGALFNYFLAIAQTTSYVYLALLVFPGLNLIFFTGADLINYMGPGSSQLVKLGLQKPNLNVEKVLLPNIVKYHEKVPLKVFGQTALIALLEQKNLRSNSPIIMQPADSWFQKHVLLKVFRSFEENPLLADALKKDERFVDEETLKSFSNAFYRDAQNLSLVELENAVSVALPSKYPSLVFNSLGLYKMQQLGSAIAEMPESYYKERYLMGGSDKPIGEQLKAALATKPSKTNLFLLNYQLGLNVVYGQRVLAAENLFSIEYFRAQHDLNFRRVLGAEAFVELKTLSCEQPEAVENIMRGNFNECSKSLRSTNAKHFLVYVVPKVTPEMVEIAGKIKKTAKQDNPLEIKILEDLFK